MIIAIIGIQLLGSIAWLVYDHPDVREIHPAPLQAVLTCKVSTTALMMSLIYNIILILLCTIYAFKTRKIPENFNEAKYIGFTMYSTCIVWLSFIPIYFGTKNDYKIQLSSLCMCLSISATVVLGCLFTPKVYLVLFQPYKNVRPRNNGGGGTTTGGELVSSILLFYIDKINELYGSIYFVVDNSELFFCCRRFLMTLSISFNGCRCH